MIGYSFSTVVGKVSGGFDGELQLVLWAAAVLPLFLFCFRMEQNGRLAELIDRLFRTRCLGLGHGQTAEAQAAEAAFAAQLYMTPQQVLALHRMGMEVGAHGWHSFALARFAAAWVHVGQVEGVGTSFLRNSYQL